MSRRLFILPLLALTFAVLGAEPVLAQENFWRVRLQLKWLHQFQFAGYYAAIEKGYYRDVGLDVQLLEATANEEPAQVVLRGGAEYGIATSDLVLYRSRGEPVVALASIFQHSPYVLVTSEKIDHLHDLIGRRIMIEPHADELMAYFSYEGIAKERLRLQPHNFDVSALIKGEVDAMSAYATDEAFLLKQAGFPYKAFSPRSGGIDFYGDTLFTTEAELRRNPTRVQAFVDASLKGWAYALNNPDEIIQLILARYSQRHTREHLQFEAEQTRRLIRNDIVELGYMNPGRWRHIAEVYGVLGMMPKDFSLEGFLRRAPEPVDVARLYLVIAVSLAGLLVIGGVSVRFFQLNIQLRRQIAERIAVEAKLRESEEELRRIANVDSLTGVFSRRNFLQHFTNELERARRYNRDLALLIFDVDRFKAVNDSFGHLAGDEALRCLCEAARGAVRQTDLIGRVGGEEFGVLLPETSVDGALRTAERIRRAAEVLDIIAGPHRIKLTISVGGTMVRAHDTAGSAIARADGALYEAKRAGRNRTVLYAYGQEETTAPAAEEAPASRTA